MATTYELIAKNVLGSDTATVTFSSIPGTGYTDLVLVASCRSSLAAGNDDLYLQFNSDSSSAYSQRHIRGTGSGRFSGATSSQTSMYLLAISAGSTTSDTFSSTEIYIPNYANTTTNKSVSYTNLYENNATAAIIAAGAGLWGSTNAITQIDLFTPSSDFVTGSSFYLYGITKS